MSGAAGDWLPIHRALFDHPKAKRLAKRLNIDTSAACGYLICLWTWAMSVAPTGELARFDPEEVESAAGWGGDDGVFFKAAKSCHWIDENHSIHDWLDWAGELVIRRAKDAERKRIERASSGRPPDTSDGCPESDPKCPDVPVKEREKEREERRPVDASTDPLTTQARKIIAWRSRSDDDEFFRRLRGSFTEAHIATQLRNLAIRQAANTNGKRYRDARVAFGNWMKREQADDLDPVRGSRDRYYQHDDAVKRSDHPELTWQQHYAIAYLDTFGKWEQLIPADAGADERQRVLSRCSSGQLTYDEVLSW